MKEHYIQAFKQFSNAEDADFQYIVDDYGVYFLWNNVTYIVKRDDDIKKLFREIFAMEDPYDDIQAQSEPFIWKELLTEMLEVSYSEVAADLYRHWKEYWRKQKQEIKGGDARYQQFRKESWEDLQFLILLTRDDLSLLVDMAEEIDGHTFTPLIALATYDRYESEEDFLDDIIDVLEEYGASILAMGDTFETIGVELSENEFQLFFVYNDIHDFDDVIEFKSEEAKRKK